MRGQPRGGKTSPLLPITTPSTLMPPLSDVQLNQEQSSPDRAASRDGDGDDHATAHPPAVRWPRLFPGL
jgi:hypothetical protein